MAQARLWAANSDSIHFLLALVRGCLYLVCQNRRDHEKSCSALLAGVDPETALPANRERIGPGQLMAVRPQQNGPTLEFRYIDDKQKERYTCLMLDPASVADAAQTICQAMGLPTTPRQEQATVGEITRGPVWTAAVPLLMLSIFFVLTLTTDMDAPLDSRQTGKAKFWHAISRALGPWGLLAVMGGVVLLAFGYWLYRYVNRPIVHVYRTEAREQAVATAGQQAETRSL